jgi:protein subunit release factor B
MSVIEIQAGSGGAEARQCALSIAHAVLKFAERGGIPARLDEQTRLVTITLPRIPDELAGLAGTHRFQRIPPGRKGQKRQTALCVVTVLDDTRPRDVIRVREEDIDITTKRGHGRGGQRRNKVETAVEAVYRPDPTIRATVNSGRSQAANKQAAIEEIARRVTAKAAADAAWDTNQVRRSQSGPEFAFTHLDYNEVIRHADGRRWRMRDWTRGLF